MRPSHTQSDKAPVNIPNCLSLSEMLRETALPYQSLSQCRGALSVAPKHRATEPQNRRGAVQRDFSDSTCKTIRKGKDNMLQPGFLLDELFQRRGGRHEKNADIPFSMHDRTPLHVDRLLLCPLRDSSLRKHGAADRTEPLLKSAARPAARTIANAWRG